LNLTAMNLTMATMASSTITCAARSAKAFLASHRGRDRPTIQSTARSMTWLCRNRMARRNAEWRDEPRGDGCKIGLFHGIRHWGHWKKPRGIKAIFIAPALGRLPRQWTAVR
jgi:hypothetical protein